jgi:hypothetical protein
VAGLEESSRAGSFFAAVTGYLVRAHVPRAAHGV